ncbi:hypothetical protein NQ314_012086 [Rhamnusium bicolor]|uniref:DDE-1 domain-containing protein n=1 Tax=Rhamnusium bicolor TaxID=1586634 RepID=A0AAV8XF08_9CUCU|nr:hypothetical protein NQ314_012086 [Rhamnusium bicolor]
MLVVEVYDKLLNFVHHVSTSNGRNVTMPRFSKRKTIKGSFSEDTMREAVTLVIEGRSVMVFSRVHFKDHMLVGAAPGTLRLAQPTDWMTAFLFVEVMKHLIQHTSSSLDNSSLLIFDNHESHLSLEVLKLAKTYGVEILTLPTHSSNKLQPLDVGVFGPFQTYYRAAHDSWMIRNPGKTFSIYNVAEYVGIAHAKAMTPENIQAAFKKVGIFPYDRYVCTEIDFLPSKVTDRPDSTTENSPSDQISSELSNVIEPESTVQQPPTKKKYLAEKI